MYLRMGFPYKLLAEEFGFIQPNSQHERSVRMPRKITAPRLG